MKNLGKIRKVESNKNVKLYWIGFIILSLLALLFIVLLMAIFGSEYRNALNECINSGYDISYCETMLN